MFVEIGINTIKSDYFKTNEEVEKVLNICKSLDVDYSANVLIPCNKSEVRVVCTNKKAKEFLKLLKQSNIHYDHYITKKKNKNFIKKIKCWTYGVNCWFDGSTPEEKIKDMKDFFDTRVGYTNYIEEEEEEEEDSDTESVSRRAKFVVECYDNDFSIISEHFYLWNVDLYSL